MKYDLNWDSGNTNGVILNDKYLAGAIFEGADKKPMLSVQYDWFMYYETQDTFIIHRNGILENMTDAMKVEIKSIAELWVQAEGDEGNPTLQQMKDAKVEKETGLVFSELVHDYDTGDGFFINTGDIMMAHLNSLVIADTNGIVLDTSGVNRTVNKNKVAEYFEGIHAAHAAMREAYFLKVEAIMACQTKACVESL